MLFICESRFSTGSPNYREVEARISHPADELHDATCVRREGESVANPGNKHDMSRRDFVKTVGIGIGALQTAAVGAGVLELTGCGAVRSTRPPRRSSPGRSPSRSTPPRSSRFARWRSARRSGSCIRAMSRCMRSTSTARGRWAVRCSTSCARIWRRHTRERPTWRGCSTTSPSPTFTSPTRNRRRSRSISAGARPMGPASSGESSAYSPILLSTPQVLDAAIQTINALHKSCPSTSACRWAMPATTRSTTSCAGSSTPSTARSSRPARARTWARPASITSSRFRPPGSILRCSGTRSWAITISSGWAVLSKTPRRGTRTSATPSSTSETMATRRPMRSNRHGAYMGVLERH